MRVLLDENMPADLAAALVGHEVSSVLGLGWRGVKNRELLGRVADRFDVLLTMDRDIRFPQNLSRRDHDGRGHDPRPQRGTHTAATPNAGRRG